jgi:hypothetical protein
MRGFCDFEGAKRDGNERWRDVANNRRACPQDETLQIGGCSPALYSDKN